MWPLYDFGLGLSLLLSGSCIYSNIPSRLFIAELEIAMSARASRLMMLVMIEFRRRIFELKQQLLRNKIEVLE